MKKVIAREFIVKENDIQNPERQLKVGEKYIYFQDPETEKFYNPVDGLTIEGEDLSDRFFEI